MKLLCLTSWEELADYRESWEKLREECAGMIYCSHSLTQLWLHVFKNVASPRIIVVEDKGDLVGIAPFAASNYKVAGLPIRVLALVGDVEYRIRLSSSAVLFPPDRRDVLQEIVGEIKRLDWNKFTANNMQDTPSVREFIDVMASIGREQEYLPGNMTTMSIPVSGDIIKAFPRNARKNTHKLLNRLKREKPDFEFREITPERLSEALDIYAKQHLERWKSKGGSVFQFPENAEFVERSIEAALSNQAAYAYELLIEGQVAAQMLGFIEDGAAFGLRQGMNDAFARYSPGWLIHYYSLNELQKRGVDKYHMGLGKESYKGWMGGKNTSLPGVKVNRGIASWLMRMAASSTLQRIDSVLGITRRSLTVNSPSMD